MKPIDPQTAQMLADLIDAGHLLTPSDVLYAAEKPWKWLGVYEMLRERQGAA